MCFQFRICFGKTRGAFNFDEKSTQSVAQKNYVISSVKRHSFSVLGSWFQDMIWKKEECHVSKSIKLII